MILNKLVVDETNRIIIGKTNHVCQHCKKTGRDIAGKKVHHVINKDGAPVILCHDCLDSLAKLTGSESE